MHICVTIQSLTYFCTPDICTALPPEPVIVSCSWPTLFPCLKGPIKLVRSHSPSCLLHDSQSPVYSIITWCIVGSPELLTGGEQPHQGKVLHQLRGRELLPCDTSKLFRTKTGINSGCPFATTLKVRSIARQTRQGLSRHWPNPPNQIYKIKLVFSKLHFKNSQGF